MSIKILKQKITKQKLEGVTKETWSQFSKKEQILDIAAEFRRIYKGELYRNVAPKDIKKYYERALELIDLTLHDPKWRGHHELYQLRDSLAALYLGEPQPAIVNFFYSWLINLSQNV